MKCIASLCCFAAALASIGWASIVTVTITGHVYSGSDLSQRVFGLGSTLSNTMPFTLEFTYDDTKGTLTGMPCGGTTDGYVSQVYTVGSDNPGTATLEIDDSDSKNNSGLFTWGNSIYLPISFISSYAIWYVPNSCSSSNSAGFGVSVNYSTGGFYGTGTVGYASGPYIFAASGSLSSNFDWRGIISIPVALKNTPAGWYTIPFNIRYTDNNQSPAVDYYAYGQLNPEYITIDGPPCGLISRPSHF